MSEVLQPHDKSERVTCQSVMAEADRLSSNKFMISLVSECSNRDRNNKTFGNPTGVSPALVIFKRS